MNSSRLIGSVGLIACTVSCGQMADLPSGQGVDVWHGGAPANSAEPLTPKAPVGVVTTIQREMPESDLIGLKPDETFDRLTRERMVELEPDESSDRVSSEAHAANGEASFQAVSAASRSVVYRSDARGKAVMGITIGSGPVYLTPRYHPVLVPGSPSVLPAFTPRPVDTSGLPVDAFAELARLGRLRERIRTRWAWLVGYSFPKISAEVAKSRLLGGTSIYLAPNGHHWNRDRAYAVVNDVQIINDMLEQLRQNALQRAEREAREANINGRMAILPAFNRTYDVFKLLMWDWVVDGYTYGGQPVRRGMVACANWFEYDEIKRRVAIYWEDHPRCTAADLRLVATRELVDKIRDVQRSASSYANNPAVYRDAQAIPGLRDPRPVVGSNRSAHDADVQFNLQAIRGVCQSMPALLESAVYP